MDSTVWIILAVVAALIIVAVIAALASKQKKAKDHSKAGELREHASAQASSVQQRDAEARETDARARQAQAEADQKAAEAERLQAQSTDRRSVVESQQDEHDETLQKADELDPNVKHKQGETGGYDGSTEERR